MDADAVTGAGRRVSLPCMPRVSSAQTRLGEVSAAAERLSTACNTLIDMATNQTLSAPDFESTTADQVAESR